MRRKARAGSVTRLGSPRFAACTPKADCRARSTFAPVAHAGVPSDRCSGTRAQFDGHSGGWRREDPPQSGSRILLTPCRLAWQRAQIARRFSIVSVRHAYFVQPQEDAEEFFAFVTLIKREGEPRLFGKTTYRYLEVGEHVYWVSRSWYDRGALIVNRRLAADDQGGRFDGSNYA